MSVKHKQNNRDASNTHEEDGEADGADYSRRSFMKTAAATGVVTGSSGLAGCSGNGDGSDGGPDRTSTQDFLWWTMEGDVPEITDALREVAAGFEDEADEPLNVTTKVVPWQDVFQEWEATIQGRATPNVSQMGNEHSTGFGLRGANRPVTEVFEQHDDWYDMMYPWSQWDGERWGVPWYVETRPLFYNMEALESAGHSSPPENWKEMVQTAIDVSEGTEYFGYADAGATDLLTGQHVFSYTAQAGGTMFEYDEDADEWRVTVDEPLSLFAHLWYGSYGKEWGAAPGGWGGVDTQGISELYREEQAGMARQTGTLASQIVNNNPELAEKTELSLIPTGPDGNNWSYFGGGCLAPFTEEVTRYDADNEIEDAFMSYMIRQDTYETQMLAGAPRMLPTREGQEEVRPFTENPTDVPDDWLDTFVEQASTALRTGIHGGGRNAPFLGSLEGQTTSYSTAMSGIIGNDADPKQALQNMANNMRRAISDVEDYDLPQRGEDELPSLDDLEDAGAPQEVFDWLEGSNGANQIWNPYD